MHMLGGNPLNFVDPLGLFAEVCARAFSPIPIPYAQHCFIRYNGDNNDTQSYDNKGVHADPVPEKASCSATKGEEDDDCVRREMKKCQAVQYDFTGNNCCHCVENALKACGLQNGNSWPNWPINPGPQPRELGYTPFPRR
jgi:hypothetical protein